jgi:hypothetical protein
MPTELRIGVQLGMLGLPGDHPAQLQGTDEFLHDIHDEIGITVKDRAVSPANGTRAKGGLPEILLTPGSASAAWALVRIVKLWLARDRRRTIDITLSGPGEESFTVQASGENLSVDALEGAVRKVLESRAATNASGVDTTR